MSKKVREILDGDRPELVEDSDRTGQMTIEKYRKMKRSISSNPLDIIGADPNKDYYWFPRSVNNEHIPMSLERAAMMGWSPVKNSELPEMSQISNMSFMGRSGGVIENGNLVLHSRDIAFKKEDEREYIEKRAKILQALNYPVGLDPFGTPLVTSNMGLERL